MNLKIEPPPHEQILCNYINKTLGQLILMSVNEIQPVYVILQEKKFHQKVLQNPRPEN